MAPLAKADQQDDQGSAASPLQGARRLVRVAALGGSSLLLATAAHLVGGGQLPTTAWLLVLTVLLGMVATTLTARRVRLSTLMLVLGVEQVGLHAALAWMSVPPPDAGCGSWHSAAHHVAAAATCPSGSGEPAAGGAGSVTGPGLLMWAAHTVAVVLTAVLLARGEAWLWQIADRLHAVAHAAPACRARRRRTVAVTPLSLARPSRLPDPAAAPRGPPRFAVSAA